MALTSGTKLGPYEILSPLGAGSMGEVYRARDSKLGREVALKVLPEAFAQDAQRMARFQREAQVLASLNHTNIASIYGLEDSGRIHALVMELVEGPTLAERIGAYARAGTVLKPAPIGAAPIPLDESLHIARQIAEALEAAHEKGIIHRDLKPANIKITPDGTVKVLDFGLAKALDAESSASNISNSPTMTAAATHAGMILGTAAYMSPEQAKGKTVDRRTDIWAYGCVLYEMLTGTRSFDGETVSDVLAAVIRAEPDWATLPAGTPPRIRDLIRRCLLKDPKQRLRDIGEARIAIDETLDGTPDVAKGASSTGGSPRQDAVGGVKPPLHRALPWAIAVGSLLLAAALALMLLSRHNVPAERMQFTIPVQGEVSHLALSADGRMLAFVAREEASGSDMLYFERLGSPPASLLAGTEGASYPFWSPDDAYLGFFANGKLQKVAVSGGRPQVLASASHGRGGTWGSRGVIIYSPETGGPLWQVKSGGSNAAPLTDKIFLPPEQSHRWPVFLPDGNHFLFWSGNFGARAGEGKNGAYLSSLEATEKKFLVPADSNPGYSDGHLYFMDQRKSLMAVPFNIAEGNVAGEPIVVSDRVTYQPGVSYGVFTIGGKDAVVYNTSTGSVLSVLTWYDRAGKELGRVSEPGVMANPSLSPDGKYAVVDIADLKNSNVELWMENLDAQTSSRFTFAHGEEVTGAWSRDGKLIAYRTTATGMTGIIIKSAAGLEPPKTIYVSQNGDDIMPTSWSTDDKEILCSSQTVAGGSHLALIEVATGKLKPLIASKTSEADGQISPEGKWVVYASDESGEWEIYVTTFPQAEGKWQVSRGGGTQPRWRGDGKEIYYIDSKGMLAAAPVNAEAVFSAGAPSTLFPVRGRASISSTDLYTYDVTKDGKRFLVNRYVKPDHIEPLTVVLNAAPGMKK